MALKTVIGSANRITFITEKDSVSDTSRPTMIPPSSCPHSAIKWHSNGTTDTQLTKSKKDKQIKFLVTFLCYFSQLQKLLTQTLDTFLNCWNHLKNMKQSFNNVKLLCPVKKKFMYQKLRLHTFEKSMSFKIMLFDKRLGL